MAEAQAIIAGVSPAAHPTGWSYAPPAAGIVNSTANVTAKAAAGAGLRNYVTGIQLSAETLGAATTFVISSGAALWRFAIGTDGLKGGLSVVFNPPLQGSDNTIILIKTETASVTGAVHANLQGFVAP